jgi:hypothetical protein
MAPAPATAHRTPSRNGAAPPRPAISTHLQLISPKQARAILETETYPQQRPLRPYQVQYLSGLIARGSLRPGTLISFAVIKGTRYLINGQHTLAALGDSRGGPLWLQEEEIRVATLEEAGQLYETYDRNLARSWADLYRADQTLQRYELLPKHLRLLGGAARYLANGFTQHIGFARNRHGARVLMLKDTQVRFALMADWQNEMHNMARGCVAAKSVRSLLERAPVLSVILVTYRFQPEQAHLFWPKLASDSGLEAGMPAHSLLRFLREMPLRKCDPAGYARSVAAAWNAAFDQRSLFKLQARPPAHPILLAGTPHDGTVHKGYLRDDGQVLQVPEPMEGYPVGQEEKSDE